MRSFASLLLLAAAAAAPLARGDATVPSPRLELLATRAHFVDPRDCRYLNATFKPSPADARRIDKLLPGVLRVYAAGSDYRGTAAWEVLGHLASDDRYYSGRRDGTIVVDGFCSDIDISYGDAGGRCPPIVNDGGSCVWQIVFDPKTNTFSHFGHNGKG